MNPTRAWEAIEKAEKHRALSQLALSHLDSALQKLLQDANVCIFYQHSDGWVVLWGHDQNTPVTSLDLPKLLRGTKDEALQQLWEHRI